MASAECHCSNHASAASAIRPVRATALVLAGGRSARFGANKLGVRVGGQPLLWHALRAAAEVCEEVVVVTTPHDLDVYWPSLPTFPGAPIRIVGDDAPFEGPLLGVLAGLRAARQPLCLVVAGDMPLLQRSLLAHMLATARGDQALIPRSVGLLVGGAMEPLPLVLWRDSETAIAAMISAGRRALRELPDFVPFRALEAVEWQAYDPTGISCKDVDRPTDLGLVRKELRRQRRQRVGRHHDHHIVCRPPTSAE
jgi:molybdopterin-guanine dinucleotide biosynthesis protein A